MSEADLLEVTKCKTLQEIGAQHAVLTLPALRALMDLPKLERLDLEATRFDDDMARMVSASRMLTSLDLGGTRLTGRGLAHICRMKQLRSLDLWATGIKSNDIDHLRELPSLEYLSLGDYKGGSTYSAEDLLPRLLELPALERIWLDGIAVTDSQKRTLEKRFSSVRLTSQ